MKKNAFTLIELLLVIGVISLLVALLVPLLAAVKRKQMKNELKQSATNNSTLTVSNLDQVLPIGSSNVFILTKTNK